MVDARLETWYTLGMTNSAHQTTAQAKRDLVARLTALGHTVRFADVTTSRGASHFQVFAGTHEQAQAMAATIPDSFVHFPGSKYVQVPR